MHYLQTLIKENQSHSITFLQYWSPYWHTIGIFWKKDKGRWKKVHILYWIITVAVPHHCLLHFVILTRVTKLQHTFDRWNQKAIGYCLLKRMADGQIMNLVWPDWLMLNSGTDWIRTSNYEMHSSDYFSMGNIFLREWKAEFIQLVTIVSWSETYREAQNCFTVHVFVPYWTVNGIVS